VILYIVDSHGVSGPIKGPGRGAFDQLRETEEMNNDPHVAMNLLASVTGGRYLFNTNDLTSGFQQAAADVRGSYRLGFYAPETDDGKWHKLKIQVKESGVTVRHREGYRTDSAAPSGGFSEESWRAAMANPLGSSVIPVTATYSAASAGERVLNLVIGVDGVSFHRDGEDLKADLQIAICELTAEGQLLPAFTSKLSADVPAAQWEAVAKTGISFHRQWTPAPSAARTRVVVMDFATGRYGSVDIQAR